MDKDLEALLREDLLDVPQDFTQRVMVQVHATPLHASLLPRRKPRILERLQQLALITGSIAGAAQLAAFMFGIWAASSAG